MADPRFFRNTGPYTLGELAVTCGAKLHQARDNEKLIRDIAPLTEAGAEHISFLDNPKYAGRFAETKAGACIIHRKHLDKAPEGLSLLFAENPYYAYALVAWKFYPSLASSTPSHSTQIALNASIHETAMLGANVTVGEHAVIGARVEVGEGCRIRAGAVINEGVVLGKRCVVNANVNISNAIIGNDVILYQGANIGQDGYGYAQHQGRHFKVPQLGRVIIGDHVEIGAGVCVDRGSGPDTEIGEGTKIDNLVQIAHNVRIGKHCLIIAQVGIAGSTQIGDYTVIGGQAGFAGHLEIGAMVQVAAQAGVTKNVAKGEKVGGFPAVPLRDWHRQMAALNRLSKKRSDQS